MSHISGSCEKILGGTISDTSGRVKYLSFLFQGGSLMCGVKKLIPLEFSLRLIRSVLYTVSTLKVHFLNITCL